VKRGVVSHSEIFPTTANNRESCNKHSWLGGMAVWESLELWPQHNQPWFVPTEVPHEIGTGTPDAVRVQVNGCEDIEQVFDIHIFRHDPSCFFVVGATRRRIN
jgi:hypothetical protein